MTRDIDPPNDDEAQGGESDGVATPTARVVEAFGGIRPMAHKLGIPVTTVQGWKRRNHIPENRHQEIEAAAAAQGIALEAGLLEAAGAVAASEGPSAAATAPPADEPPIDRAGPATSDTTPDPAANGGGRLTPRSVWTAAAIAVAGAIASISAPVWAPSLFASGPSAPVTTPAELVSLADRVEFLENRIAELPATPIASTATVSELAERLTALEERPAPTPDIGRVESVETELAQLSGRIDRMEERIAEAEARLAGNIDPAALNASLAELKSAFTERLDAVERSVIEARTRDAAAQALAVAAGTLRAAVMDGRPWATDLDTVRALAAGDPAIAPSVDALAPRAASGVPTIERLKSSFAAAAVEARLEARVPDDAGVLDRALDAITGLVTVRPAPGEVEGDAPDQILARAEGRLIEGDLSGAVEALAALSGSPADAMAVWVAEAKARLEAGSAADSLVAATLARLGGASGGSGTP